MLKILFDGGVPHEPTRTRRPRLPSDGGQQKPRECNMSGTTGVWIPPAMLGLMLVLVGVLIIVMPQLLAYFVATAFIMAGVGMLGIAMQMRTRVTFRRIDEA